MKDAVTPAVRRAVMPWEDNAAFVTTPVRSVLMRELIAAPPVTQVYLKYTSMPLEIININHKCIELAFREMQHQLVQIKTSFISSLPHKSCTL